MVSVPLSPSSRERAGGTNGSAGQGRDASGEARFEALPDSVPPQNLEAEEAVLGGILLDPDAIGRVADVLRPEAFYLTAHREIYRTALMLHGQGKPTDLTAMTAWPTPASWRKWGARGGWWSSWSGSPPPPRSTRWPAW
jgi:replicative DNA helicase